MTFLHVLATELLKLRRARVTWLSLAALSLAGAARDRPVHVDRARAGRARQLGLLGAKADLSGISATWPSYFSMLTLIVGMGGLLLLAFIVAFVFAREYVEGTAKNLLALPVGRHWFVLAKLVVAGAWWALLVAAVTAETFLIGSVMALPGFSASVVDALGTSSSWPLSCTCWRRSSPGSPRSRPATWRRSGSRWRCSCSPRSSARPAGGRGSPGRSSGQLRRGGRAGGHVDRPGQRRRAGRSSRASPPTIAQLRYVDNTQ